MRIGSENTVCSRVDEAVSVEETLVIVLTDSIVLFDDAVIYLPGERLVMSLYSRQSKGPGMLLLILGAPTEASGVALYHVSRHFFDSCLPSWVIILIITINLLIPLLFTS